jgi:hypothetical protein
MQGIMKVERPAPSGVEGWLLVLCLILTLVAPAVGLYHIIEHTIPILLRVHDFRNAYLLSVYLVVFSGLIIYSFVAGVRLWLIKPGAVRFAKRYFWTFLVANLAYFLFWVMVVRPKLLSSYAAMAWSHVVGAILPFTLWYFYLEHSKRVRATYS